MEIKLDDADKLQWEAPKLQRLCTKQTEKDFYTFETGPSSTAGPS